MSATRAEDVEPQQRTTTNNNQRAPHDVEKTRSSSALSLPAGLQAVAVGHGVTQLSVLEQAASKLLQLLHLLLPLLRRSNHRWSPQQRPAAGAVVNTFNIVHCIRSMYHIYEYIFL